MSGPILATPAMEPVSAEPVAVSDPHFLRIAWQSLKANPVAFVSVLIVLVLADRRGLRPAARAPQPAARLLRRAHRKRRPDLARPSRLPARHRSQRPGRALASDLRRAGLAARRRRRHRAGLGDRRRHRDRRRLHGRDRRLGADALHRHRALVSAAAVLHRADRRHRSEHAERRAGDRVRVLDLPRAHRARARALTQGARVRHRRQDARHPRRHDPAPPHPAPPRPGDHRLRHARGSPPRS